MNSGISLAILFLLTVSAGPAVSQSRYDPHEAFDPLFDAGSKGTIRGSNGAPGPSYWQNRADYSIDGTLDDSAKTITGTVRITYTNNSPDTLPYLWLALDQNEFRSDSRSALLSTAQPAFKGGFAISSVAVEQKGKKSKGDWLVNDTRMQIRLPAPLPPRGGKAIVTISYSFPLAPSGMGRSGWLATKNGKIFDVAQWYPRMEVYDDISGWNVLPFLGSGEFYLDYGDIDYRVTVPADQIVIGSGKLLNGGEVLTPKQLDRLARARVSDAAVAIRDLDDLRSAAGAAAGMRTWHFRMENTRDVVWASSRAFLWDAAKFDLPGGRTGLAVTAYPEESAADTAWKRSAEYVKATVEIFSRDWFPYPYPEAAAVGGPVGGMEYPGVIFGHWKASKKVLWMLIHHEVGHEWFPMIVGSNERADAWMDEGFNTFIDIYGTEEFHNGEFAPKRDGEYAPKGGNPAREIVPLFSDSAAQPVVSYADALPGRLVHPLEYYKCALGLVLLREEILGHERFDYAFRRYIHEWAFKHPAPYDFFRAMNNGAGENLDWFWRGWFIRSWKLDQAVKDVRYVDGDTAKGALITVSNNEQMPMPLTVSVTAAGGRADTLRFPVEVWEDGATFTFRYPSTRPVVSVIVDPLERLPDVDSTNDRWPR